MRISNTVPDAALFAGLGSADITPPIGAELYGYYPHPIAESVTDRLIAFALALSYGDVKALVLSVPVCLIENALANEVREQISHATGVDAACVLLCATHTHSGPKTNSLPDHGVADEDYCTRVFIPMLVQAATEAVSHMVPAEVGISEGESRVGVNRRHINELGEVRHTDERGTSSLWQNPWGLFDPTMTVLAFRNAETHTPIATVVHYGAHNTAAGIVRTITRDWCGVMCDRLAYQTGAPALFINGSEGDVAPRISSGASNGRRPDNMESMREVGYMAALDAVRIYRTIREYRALSLEAVVGEVSLPYNNGEGAFTFRQTILRLGHVVMIPIPFEFFSSISLRLREFTGYQHTLCLGATNGSNSYLPSKDQMPMGGYEVRMFFSRGDKTLALNTDDTIISENLRILKELNWRREAI